MFFTITNSKEVIEDIMVYKKETKKGNFVFENIIVGLPSSSKYVPLELQVKLDVIYEGLTNSKFSREPTKISKGYKKITVNKEWILSVYLNSYISPEKIQKKIQKLNKGGLELGEWIEHYRDKWLTIKDVKELPLNKKVKLLLLDRNIYDDKDHIKEAKLYTPFFFFKKNVALYWKTNNNNLMGKIKYKWQKETDEPYDFEFHIEYDKNKWYPLTNGLLPAKDDQNITKLLDKETHITEFSEDTHLGYRGPIMFWDEIKDLDKVYIYES